MTLRAITKPALGRLTLTPFSSKSIRPWRPEGFEFGLIPFVLGCRRGNARLVECWSLRSGERKSG